METISSRIMYGKDKIIIRWAVALLLMVSLITLSVEQSSQAFAAVGDQVHQITVPVSGAQTFCSIGLAFDGTSLYYDRCGDPNIYKINPITGALENTFNTGIAERPNALAFDAKRNGLWIGAQGCNANGMPIYFWDFDDNSVTLKFTILFSLTNPATGASFLGFCFVDGLAYNENDPTTETDDEIWFSDDVNRNIGLFRPDGTFVKGFDATSVHPSLSSTSGLAIGGPNLYLANNGGGDVFRANKSTDPLTFVDQFTSGDERQEDMECDPVTFAPKEVMWVRTTPQGGAFPDVITAFEIEPNTCGLGGQPPKALDHFLCYKTKGEQEVNVTLTDQFDSGNYEGKIAKQFCTPAGKNGGSINDPDTHLKVYKIKGPHERRTNVEVTNQFGTFIFDTKKTDTLMVPTAKSLPPDPPPGLPDPGSEVDHYRCLKAKTSPGTPTFPKGITVTVDDQFGSRQAKIIKPTKLCVPTDKNGEGIKNPDAHLMCYKVKPVPKTKVTGVQVNNQFGPEVLDLKGEAEFCVPSVKTLAGP